MKNSKLIRVLQQLNSKELRRLEQFLASPYFNQRQDVQQLFHALLPFLPAEADVPDKKTVYHLLFPQQAFDLQGLDLLMSYLYRLVTTFLQQEEWKLETWRRPLSLARSFRKRGLQREFKQQMNQLRQRMDRQTLRNANYYDFQYDWLLEQSHVHTNEHPTQPIHLTELTHSIDWSYLSTKLRHACPH